MKPKTDVRKMNVYITVSDAVPVDPCSRCLVFVRPDTKNEKKMEQGTKINRSQSFTCKWRILWCKIHLHGSSSCTTSGWKNSSSYNGLTLVVSWLVFAVPKTALSTTSRRLLPSSPSDMLTVLSYGRNRGRQTALPPSIESVKNIIKCYWYISK